MSEKAKEEKKLSEKTEVSTDKDTDETSEEKTEVSTEKDADATPDGNTSEDSEILEDIIKAKKAYKKGTIIYDIGMLIFSLFLIAGSVRFFMRLDLFIGGAYVTNLLNFLLVLPGIMMIAGLAISHKAAVKLGKKEKGGKGMLIAMIIAIAVILGAGILDLFHPSYHVYSTEICKASDGREFMVAKSERVPVSGTVHNELPSYYDLDVYDVNGIFARKLCTAEAHTGTYNIEKTNKGYRLNVKYLGMEEGIPFNI